MTDTVLNSCQPDHTAQSHSRRPAGRFARLPVQAAVLSLAALLSACSFIPTLEVPAAPVASQWPDLDLGAAAGQVDAQGQNLVPWQQFLTDANLRELVEQSLQNNRDLRVAALAIEQAQAQYRIQRAGPLPTVSAGATGQRQTVGDDEPINSTYTAGLQVSAWEIDFFGRLRSLREAALADYLGTEYAHQAVQTSLIASVASAWLNLQTASALLDLTGQTLQTREESQRLMQMRFDNGVVSALELSQTESLTASARITLAEQQRARAQAINALTLLVGSPIEPRLLQPVDVPLDVLGDVPAGLPSQLLTRRADIRQAEQAMRAANANIGAARAAFFPSISLTASLGSASTQLSDLFSSGSFGWSIAPQAILPIFDAGRNRARLEAAQVGRDMAVAQYEKSIQSAFTEVADALAARATLAQQLEGQQSLVAAETRRYELADLRYQGGVASFMDALDAQRSLFSAQQAVLQTRAALLANRVELYRVLGGGWQPPQ